MKKKIQKIHTLAKKIKNQMEIKEIQNVFKRGRKYANIFHNNVFTLNNVFLTLKKIHAY